MSIRKKVLFAIIAVVLLIGIIIPPVKSKMVVTDGSNLVSNDINIWTPEDEGSHFPCGCEWWMFYVSLELEDGTRWDASATFQCHARQTEDGPKMGTSILLMYYFDGENKKCHEFSSQTYKEKPFTCKNNMVDLKYYNSTIKGLYPTYKIHLEDPDKCIILDVQLNATSLPHWAAQEGGGDGYFPWGLGVAKYGYIPRLDVSGNINIYGVNTSVNGVGYFEHAWGDFTYNIGNPFAQVKGFARNILKILPIVRWYFSEQSISIPSTLMFSTDNLFGYDWVWGHFDNGWSLHLAVMHLGECIAAGSMPAVLSLTPDGQTYFDFADLDIKYGKMYYIDEADAYLPLEIELTARKGDKRLFLNFSSITNPQVKGTVNIFPLSRLSCGVAGIQTAGVVEGFYRDSKQSIPLNGICTIGPYRTLYTTKHNSLKIDFPHSSKKLGLSIEIISHLLGFELFSKRQFLPYPERHFYIKLYQDASVEEPPKKPIATSQWLYVGGTNPGNFTCIQAAIDNSSDGDTVFVYSGRYIENLLVDKSIRLIGENKNQVVIDAGNCDGIKVIADNVEIAGFTIEAEQADNSVDSAIDLSSSGNYVHDNILTKSEFYGVYIYNSSYNVVEYNSFIDDDVGIWLCRASNNIIRYNTIIQSKWLGIWLWPCSKDNIICYNNFMENKLNAMNSDRSCWNKWYGNYWNDYIGLKLGRLADLSNDGFGFIPYRLSRFEFDWQPAMNQYEV